MNNLNNIRKRVFITILVAILGNALVAAVPSVDIETVKKLFITLTNVAMFILVWDAYFDEKLSQKGIVSILQDLFTITCISLITTLVISKVIVRSVDNLTTILGSKGWIIVGAIAAVATAILGIIWALYCDDLYRNSA